MNVRNAVTTVTLTATPTHTGASVSAVTLGGTAIIDTDFTDGITVPSLAEGDNEIVVTVTAEDGTTTQPYPVTVTVTRAATVPGAPTGLSATANGSTQIDLSWTAPSSDGGASISGYKIEVSPNDTSSWTDLVANNTSTTYSHTGLTAGTTRHYRVSAINSVGTGAASNVDDATTAAATTTSSDATLSALTVNDGTTEHTIDLATTPYTVNVRNAVTTVTLTATPTHTGASVSAVTLGGTAIIDTDFTDGITVPSLAEGDNEIVVTVTAEDGTTTQPYPVTVTRAATVPGAPTGLSATANGSTQIDLSWTAPSSDGGASISGYKIEVSPNDTSSWTDLVANNTSTTYSHTGLTAGTTRHYRVSAINSVGTGAASSTANATTAAAPTAPTGLTATASGTSTIDLSWNAPSDGGSVITGYKIEVSSNGTPSSWSDLVANTGNATTTYSHTGLSAGTTRHYRVSAINSVGTGTASSTANATAATVPGAPTGLTATASGSTRINLTWTAPSDGGSVITGYKIEVSSNDGTSWSNREANTNSTSTSYAHTGLSAGTTRYYRVSAINSAGTGAASSTANATTGTDTGPLVLTVRAVSATVTDGEPVRYRILMSRPTSGALVESEYSYEGEFVRNGPASVVTGVSSQNGMTYWEIGYETLDDAMVEEDGSFTVRIQKPDAYLYNQGEAYTVGTPSSATVTILDNDPEEPPTLPIVSVFDVRVDEGPGAVLAFPVRLNVAAVETATIEWETLNGSAKAGRDYEEASGTLVFSPGEKEKTVRVEVIDDTQVEGTEVMLLMLLDAQGAVVDDAVAKGTIKDNDAASDAADDALEDALAVAEGLTPDEAAGALFGERRLSEARLAALDLLGNRNGRYDLGDLLAWIDRCRRGEARCGPTSTGSGPPSAAGLLAAAAAGGRRTPRRTRRRGSGRPGRKPIRTARRRGRFAGYALAVLLAATTVWSCTEGSVAPAAYVQDPGFLTVEWSGPAASRDVGVLLELEGPTIDAVRAPGLELYESSAPGPHRIVVAGVLRPGPLVQFRVPDRGQFALYRVRVLEVTGEGYGLRDPTEYRAVVIMN